MKLTITGRSQAFPSLLPYSLEWRDLGIPMTTGSDEACKMYDAIITQNVNFFNDDSVGGVEGAILKMRQADPDFVMGHVLTSWMGQMMADTTLPEEIANMKALAEKTPGLTAREKKHVHAVDLWSQGYLDRATDVWEDIVIDHPYDVTAISMAFMTALFRGNFVHSRDCLGRALPQWKTSTPLYGNFLSRHAFGMEETNLYPQAEKTVREALAINPKDAWGTHTLCHILERVGRQEELIDTMDKTRDNWQVGVHLVCHNYWHWAVNCVEMGDYETALSIFDDQLNPSLNVSESVFNLSDVASLLCRLEFEGAPIGDRWHSVSKMYKNHLNDFSFAFYDLHTYIACLYGGEDGLAQNMMDNMRDFIRDCKGDTREVMAEVGQKVMQALTAYQEGDYAAAVDFIYPIRYQIQEVGGSYAQRDLFNLFLIQAAIRSSNKRHHTLARNLLNERKSLVCHSPMTDRLMAKVINEHDG